MQVSVLRRGRAPWSRLALLLAGASALVSLLIAPLGAQASQARHVVQYRGYRLSVPAGWPVFDLATHPHACVRFNRHAVYLGRPGSEQRCPSHVMGRTEAILVQPLRRKDAVTRPADTTLPAASVAAANGQQANEAQIVNRTRAVVITATWHRDPKVIERALGVRSLNPASARVTPRPVPTQALIQRTRLARMASASRAGQVYTGQGFDACTAPSSSQMSAWSSAYRAIGVYIGGVNMGCSQANLTSGWVSQQSAAGWHLIPIYVGLQAPGNSCGCAAIASASAAGEGKAAAQDAVAQAQGIGLGKGNPIYYDMEGYERGGTTSSSVLTFLNAWTQQLHAEGYKSGVYSSDASGIVDLVSRHGSGYSEPDDLWAAAWNGRASTSDGNIPSGEWANHQRVHQYAGNENQTHGGVTINIDADYVDATTAAAGSVGSGSSGGGQHQPTYWVFTGWGNVYGSRGSVFYGSPWASHAGDGQITGMAPTADGKGYWMVDALGRVYPYGDAPSLRQYVSANHPAISGIVASPRGGYWLYTASGAVYTSAHATWYGSPWASHTRDYHITGMAPTPDGKGYWMVDSSGRVYHYGDAQALTQYVSPNHPWISGIVASPRGGYWLYTASGTVYTSAHATWYGSPWASHIRDYHFTGMAPTADGKGYWMVDSSGHVYHYGDAPGLATGISSHSPPINGIVR
jgi:hypothetical protein